jgi:hypothetical protein
MIKIEILVTVQSRSQGLLLPGDIKEVPIEIAEHFISKKYAKKVDEDSKNDNGNGASDARATQATSRVSKPSNRKR